MHILFAVLSALSALFLCGCTEDKTEIQPEYSLYAESPLALTSGSKTVSDTIVTEAESNAEIGTPFEIVSDEPAVRINGVNYFYSGDIDRDSIERHNLIGLVARQIDADAIPEEDYQSNFVPMGTNIYRVDDYSVALLSSDFAFLCTAEETGEEITDEASVTEMTEQTTELTEQEAFAAALSPDDIVMIYTISAPRADRFGAMLVYADGRTVFFSAAGSPSPEDMAQGVFPEDMELISEKTLLSEYSESIDLLCGSDLNREDYWVEENADRPDAKIDCPMLMDAYAVGREGITQLYSKDEYGCVTRRIRDENALAMDDIMHKSGLVMEFREFCDRYLTGDVDTDDEVREND